METRRRLVLACGAPSIGTETKWRTRAGLETPDVAEFAALTMAALISPL
jgi:hypothetical protein